MLQMMRMESAYVDPVQYNEEYQERSELVLLERGREEGKKWSFGLDPVLIPSKLRHHHPVRPGWLPVGCYGLQVI